MPMHRRAMLLMIAVLTAAVALPTGASQARESRPDTGPRVIGGSDATIASAPWQVALLLPGNAPTRDRQFCGGSIIDTEWIVTAAHCVAPSATLGNSRVPNWFVVLSGTDQLSRTNPSPGSQSAVRSVIIHPDYDKDAISNDIALIRLASPLTFGTTRRAITLPAIPDWPTRGTSATITGWGRTTPGRGTLPTQLQQGSVQIIGSPKESACGDWGKQFDSTVMLCAGIPKDGGVATCPGDSGGPLAVEKNGTTFLAGITSWGHVECGKAGFPSVYTRVTAFTSWIMSARTSTPGSITVNVTSSVEAGVAVCAYAYPAVSATSEAVAGACGDAGTRTVTIPNVPSGSYELYVMTDGPYQVPGWWKSGAAVPPRNSADVVTVSGTTPTAVEAWLMVGGAIRVNLTPFPRDASSGVCLAATSPGQTGLSDAVCPLASESSGTLQRLPIGNYQVSVVDNYGVYPEQWYPASANRSGATSISVTGGGTQTISMDLTGLTKSLSGIVRSPGLIPQPQSGIRVTLTDASGLRGTQSATTDSSGRYAFSVAPGAYTVALNPRPEDAYRPDSSGLLTFNGTASQTFDFTLQPGRELSGKVTNLAGKALAGAIVQVHALPSVAWPDRPTLLMEMPTATDGSYRFRSLPPRPVQVLVLGNPLGTVRYMSKWYWDSSDRAQAQTIDLSQRASFTMGTTILEAVPGTAGTLSGRVSGDHAGGGLRLVEVRLTTEDGGTILRRTTTNAAGDYTITGIAPGNYGLDLVPDTTSPYLPSIGDIVSIVGGNTTTRNAMLQRGGAVRGLVRTAQGAPIAGVTVEARISLFPQMLTVAKAVSDATGTFTFPALSTDREATFYFTATDLAVYYQPQWYGGSSSLANAQWVTPTDGQTITLSDTIMVPGSSAVGAIHGSVVNEGLNGLENATVSAYAVSGAFLGSTMSDTWGEYSLVGLPPGPVYLRAIDDTQAFPGFLPEWYRDATSLATATPITVVGDQVTEADPIVTTEGVAIRGSVYDYDADVPVEAVVHVIDAQGTSYSVQTLAGYYNINGLPASTYKVSVNPTGGYLPMWHEEGATEGQATEIDAAAGYYYSADFGVTKTPYEPVIASIVKSSIKQRTVKVSWEATIGAGTYQLQRARNKRWQLVGRTPALFLRDTLPATVPWGRQVCYRLRVISPAGTPGPWARDCSP